MIKKARVTQLKTEFLIRSEGGYVLSWRGLQETLLDIFLHNPALISSLDFSLRLPRDTPGSFILTGYGSDPRFLGGGYKGSKFPRKSGKSTPSPVSRLLSTQLLVAVGVYLRV